MSAFLDYLEVLLYVLMAASGTFKMYKERKLRNYLKPDSSLIKGAGKRPLVYWWEDDKEFTEEGIKNKRKVKHYAFYTWALIISCITISFMKS